MTSYTESTDTDEAIRDLEDKLSGFVEQVEDLLNQTRKSIVKDVRFYKPKRIKNLPEEFSVAEEDWAERFKKYLRGELTYNRVGLINHVCYPYFCISKSDALLLWYVFGHCEDRPIPLRNKKNFDPHQVQRILCLTIISKWPPTDQEQPTTAQIFNSSDQLPNGRVYYKGTEVTDDIKGVCVEDIFDNELIPGLTDFDELYLLQC